MINYIILFLSTIKLTVTQWLLIMMAGTIGVLVVALRLQGSKLHKAQVTILTTNLNNSIKQSEAKTAEASHRFDKAYQAYRFAKKKVKR